MLSIAVSIPPPTITPRFNEENEDNYNPQHWFFEATNAEITEDLTDEDWVVLDEQEIEWPANDVNTKYFNLPKNTTEYSSYRLRVVSGNNENKLAIGELEFFDTVYATDNYYTLPKFGSKKSGISKFAFVGCPEEGERFYDILSDEHKTALAEADWLNSGNKYATIYCSTVNEVNMMITSRCSFYTENIDYLRNNSTERFNCQQNDSNNARWQFWFQGGSDIISVRNCRISALGCNIDDPHYINPAPPHKCCAFMKSAETLNLIIENNIINFITQSVSSDQYCYDLFNFDGFTETLSFSNNDCYMTKSDTTSWIHSNNTSDNVTRYARGLLYATYAYYNNAINQMNRFVACNHNKLTIRLCDYQNLNYWLNFSYFERIEMIDNTIVEGVPMKQYNSDEMNLCIFKTSLVHCGADDCRYSEYYIKDFSADLPSLWGIYNAHVLCLNFYNAADDTNHQRYGLNRGCGKNIIDNIKVYCGEGPSIEDISSANLSRTNSWCNTSAVYILGKSIWHGDCYYRYGHQANTATNISVRHPWGFALQLQAIYAEVDEIRGSIAVGDASYAKVKTMTIKKARSNALYINNTANGNLEIDQLMVEDPSISNFVSWNQRMNGRIIINKTNCSVTNSSSVFSSNANDYYNEAMVIQKDIGDNHGFLLKSANKFIESCNLKHNGTNTLKMYGTYNHDRTLKMVNCGDTGLTSKHVLPGKYKFRINYAFTGSADSTVNGYDFYNNTIANPSTDRKNLLNPNNLTMGIKTKSGVMGRPDVVALAQQGSNNAGWSSNDVIPFYHDFYVDIYEEQDIFTVIERFDFYCDDFTTSNPGAAVFMDPEIEVTKISDIELAEA